MFPVRAYTTTALTHLSLLVTLVGGMTTPAYANPEDGVVSAGAATITSAGNKLDVHQSTERVVIDWRSFNIEVDEHTQFYQPSSGSIALNRVNNGDPSHILGTLSANGNVILINPNGVMFGAGARVDVNGLVATSADIGNEDFMAGSLHFDKPGNPYAAIINEGHISAKEAGLVGLVAPNVINTGIIEAKLGRVHLAGGDTATVDFYGDGLMEVSVSEDVQSQLVTNTGTLSAAGGKIAMTAAAGKTIVNNLVVVEGELKAPAVAQRNGSITIFAEGRNAVKNNAAADKGKKQGASGVIVQGSLDVSGLNEGEHGGSIVVTGDNVAVMNGTIMNASGHSGKTGTTDGKNISDMREESAGGDIRIGGDYLGGGDTATALNLYVDPYTLFYNDALADGDAGRTIFWSDNDTIFQGNVYARGGIDGGNGGFLETSGHTKLTAQGFADLTAEHGLKGTYFLDPTNIIIRGNFVPTDVSGLQLWLDAQTLSSLNNGDTISTWDNLAPVNADATGAINLPSYSSSAFGGRGGVQFGGDKVLVSSGFPVQSVFTVARNDNAVFASYDGILGGDIANPGNGHILNGWAGSTDLYAGASGAVYSARQNGLAVSNGTFSGINTASGWIGSFVGPSAITNSQVWVGLISGGSRSWNGQIGEIIAYSGTVTASERVLLEQYQSAKWGIALDPVAGAGTEYAEAMGATGYSDFTTRYLERLSQSADISLQATNNIRFDLRGDTLALAADRNLTLTAANNIATATNSAGTISTTRTGTGGNITMNAGNLIDLSNIVLTSGNGNINLSATGNVSLNTINSGSGDLNVQGNNVLISGGGTASLANLMGYWRFDEGTGTIARDYSGNNNNGTLMNGVAWSTDIPGSPSGNSNSLNFDGNNDHVLIADSNTLDITNAFTLSTWVKSDGVQSNRYLISKRNDAGTDNVYSMIYGYAADQVQFYASGNGYGYPGGASNIPVADTNWHLVTYTYDGTTFKSYKDGILQGATTLTANLTASTSNLLLGAFNGAGYNLDGSMDDVRIYNRALSDADVKRLAQTQTPWLTGNTTITAANNITFDLKGDTMGITAGKNLVLNAGKNISNTTVGKITTTQNAGSGGDIDMTAATTGIINLNSDFTINGGRELNLATNGGNITLGNNLVLAGEANIDAKTGILTFGGTVNGTHDLNAQAKTFAFSQNWGGTTPLDDVSLISTDSITLPSISAGSITVETTGATSDIVIAAGKVLAATDAGSNVKLAAKRNFDNDGGAGAITTGSGRFLIYTDSHTGNDLDGLSTAFRRFSCTYGGACPALGTGNGILHKNTPVLTINPNAKTIAYNDPVPTFTYLLGGYLGADSGADNVTGSAAYVTSYAQGNAAGSYNITGNIGTLVSGMGYGFTSGINTGGLTVNPPVNSAPNIPATVLLVSQIPSQSFFAISSPQGSSSSGSSSQQEKPDEIALLPPDIAKHTRFTELLDGLLEIDPELAELLKF